MENKDANLTPRFHKRAFAHNYHAPFIYHIILKKSENAASFGKVKGDARIAPGNPGCAFIEESETGKTIAKEIIRLQYIFPILQIYQFVIMPDHVHILLRVKNWSDKHLDFYIQSLVDNISKSYNDIINTNNIITTHADNSKNPNNTNLFQPGYCDKPLLLKRSLDSLFRYIKENPHRLAMRQQFPHFFQTIRNLKIGNANYEAYGNLFLLRNPDKITVKISRKFSEEEIIKIRRKYLYHAGKGGILVSPFISRLEKEIRKSSEELSAKIILITHEAFTERFKPAAHDFQLCSQGRLLIISLGLPAKTKLSREICLTMNALASELASE